ENPWWAHEARALPDRLFGGVSVGRQVGYWCRRRALAPGRGAPDRAPLRSARSLVVVCPRSAARSLVHPGVGAPMAALVVVRQRLHQSAALGVSTAALPARSTLVEYAP